MTALPAIRAVLASYRSTDTHVTEEQIEAAWAEYDGLFTPMARSRVLRGSAITDMALTVTAPNESVHYSEIARRTEALGYEINGGTTNLLAHLGRCRAFAAHGHRSGVYQRAPLSPSGAGIDADPGARVPGSPRGHKLTVHIYYAGPPTQESLDAAMDACKGFPGDPTFVGMDLTDVQDEPKEQMGT